MRYTEFLDKFRTKRNKRKIYTESFDSDTLLVKAINNLLVENRERIAINMLQAMEYPQRYWIMKRLLVS